MRILIIGGSGFIGSYISKTLLSLGHTITVLAHQISDPVKAFLPGVHFVPCNLETKAGLDLLSSSIAGQEALIYCAGVDDRTIPQKPAKKFFMQGNVTLVLKVLQIAQQGGIQKFVFIGSYFRHFNEQWPQMKLADNHPYIFSRCKQREEVFTALNDSDLCYFLELPFVFGKVIGGITMWKPLFRYLDSSWPKFAPHGGTAVVSVQHVANFAAELVTKKEGKGSITLSQKNYNWKSLFQEFMTLQGKKQKIFLLPGWVLHLTLIFTGIVHTWWGKESGLNMKELSKLLTKELFLPPSSTESMDACFWETIKSIKQ